MAEFLADPSVLTKEKLKSALLANNVALPNGEQKKGVYVELYLKNLTSQNKKSASVETFSSDEELAAPVVSSRSRSGRKATRKTDRIRPFEVDVAELTNEGLKDQLLKYGVTVGPIVASTRKLYEKKLQRLLDQGPPETSVLVSEIIQTDSSRNGSADSEQYSDKEEGRTTAIPEPEPEAELEPEPESDFVPVVARPLRSRGKTPISTRQRSSQHKAILKAQCLEPLTGDMVDPDMQHVLSNKPLNSDVMSQDPKTACTSMDTKKPIKPGSTSLQPTRDWKPVAMCHSSPLPSSQAKDNLHAVSLMESPFKTNTSQDLIVVKSTSQIEKLSAAELTPKTPERDVLKEMFPHETFNTPTGISATPRQPIKGAAGRPFSDVWLDNLRPRLSEVKHTSSSYVESRSVSRVSSVPLSPTKFTAPPSGPSVQVKTRRRLPVWVQLLLLSAVAGFLFFVYQAMESNEINPFVQPDSSRALDTTAK